MIWYQWLTKTSHNYNYAELNENQALNAEAAQVSDLLDGEQFTLDNLTYSNSVIVNRVFQHLDRTDFLGISVSPIHLEAIHTVQGYNKGYMEDRVCSCSCYYATHPCTSHCVYVALPTATQILISG